MKYFIILLFLISCNNNEPPPKVSTTPLDTLKTSPAITPAMPALFERAFIKGTEEPSAIGTISLYGINAGKIKIPTGRVIACDPMLTEEYGIPFTQAFPKGEFPLQFAIGKLDGQEQIIFARILFSEAPVARWDYALLKDQQTSPIKEGKIRGYIIDSGTGSFMDEAAKKIIDTLDHDKYEAQLYKEMKENYRLRWQYTLHSLGIQNLAAFSSGGDGYYNTYIGFDATGTPCRLLTDFGVFDWRK